MQSTTHEHRPQAVAPARTAPVPARAPAALPAAALYRALYTPERPPAATLEQARAFLHSRLEQVERQPPAGLPAQPQELHGWMQAQARAVTSRWALYLERRRAGGPREYFTSRAHALHFLRGVAPTKLADGSWLYGLLEHWGDARMHGLIRTWLEELGDGDPGQNHVLMYRRLLAAHGLEQDVAEPGALDDAHHEQGAIQLALGWLGGQEFLPEAIGFNLGYEQLPLHLLITAHELDELGIDPYYFTVHVTVDNHASGHARRAVQAVLDTLPAAGRARWWQRVRNGAALSEAGLGSTGVIAGFDLEEELLRILQRKAPAGSGVHGDHCRIGGRHVNQWLAEPQRMRDFLGALQQGGWIVRGQDPAASRFWQLVHGLRPVMFGVFTPYELQVLHDWIRGEEAAMDGRAHDAPADGRRAPSFRAQSRLAQARSAQDGQPPAAPAAGEPPGARWAPLQGAAQAARMRELAEAMAPALHWQPAGLQATREYAWRLVAG